MQKCLEGSPPPVREAKKSLRLATYDQYCKCTMSSRFRAKPYGLQAQLQILQEAEETVWSLVSTPLRPFLEPFCLHLSLLKRRHAQPEKLPGTPPPHPRWRQESETQELQRARGTDSAEAPGTERSVSFFPPLLPLGKLCKQTLTVQEQRRMPGPHQISGLPAGQNETRSSDRCLPFQQNGQTLQRTLDGQCWHPETATLSSYEHRHESPKKQK